VAPGLGLTAKHVSTGFMRLDDQFDAYNRRGSVLASQYNATKTETGYFARVYQATGMGERATIDSARSVGTCAVTGCRSTRTSTCWR
jgi:hypothetical protein